MVVKRLGDREYVYVKHGRIWHYIGPLDNVDLNSIVHEYTTTLPLKARASGGLMNSGGTGSGKSAGKIIALIVGILMIIIGVIIILEIGFLLPFSFITASSVGISSNFTVFNVNNTMRALAISPVNPVAHSKVTVTAVNASFKVAITSLVSRYAAITWINVTNESLFSGNYTSFTATISNQSILIWPYRITGRDALIMVNMAAEEKVPTSSVTHISLLPLIFIAIFLILAGALIWGGVVLFRWSRK